MSDIGASDLSLRSLEESHLEVSDDISNQILCHRSWVFPSVFLFHSGLSLLDHCLREFMGWDELASNNVEIIAMCHVIIRNTIKKLINWKSRTGTVKHFKWGYSCGCVFTHIIREGCIRPHRNKSGQTRRRWDGPSPPSFWGMSSGSEMSDISASDLSPSTPAKLGQNHCMRRGDIECPWRWRLADSMPNVQGVMRYYTVL